MKKLYKLEQLEELKSKYAKMHWHLDVTFKEDSNKTIEETANKNMNIIRKWALSILKLLDMGKKMSLKLKRFSINCKPDEYISKIMEI